MFINQTAVWKSAIKNPEAHITKNRNRLKQNGTNVYLQNDDEFEIELFNPLQENVLAKIKLNGSPDSMDIIIRPGQRVFLERFLDQAKKFKFTTYNVDGNSHEAQNAILKNGEVKITFHKEQKVWTPDSYFPPFYPNDVTLNSFSTTTNGTVNLDNLMSNNFDRSRSSYSSDHFFSYKDNSNLETGRVEKGSNSRQKFESINMNFNQMYFHWTYWKILPASQKPIEAKELTVHCTECGTKRKKPSFKFCPTCGTKF